jgi:hypothetical protein
MDLNENTESSAIGRGRHFLSLLFSFHSYSLESRTTQRSSISLYDSRFPPCFLLPPCLLLPLPPLQRVLQSRECVLVQRDVASSAGSAPNSAARGATRTRKRGGCPCHLSARVSKSSTTTSGASSPGAWAKHQSEVQVPPPMLFHGGQLREVKCPDVILVANSSWGSIQEHSEIFKCCPVFTRLVYDSGADLAVEPVDRSTQLHLEDARRRESRRHPKYEVFANESMFKGTHIVVSFI